MMKAHNTWTLLALLVSATSASVDVFLTMEYVDAFAGQRPCATPSSGTDKDSRPNCFPRIANTFLEGVCYPRVSGTYTSGTGSSQYTALNETHYCRQHFADQDCKNLVDACRDVLLTGFDSATDRERFYFADMCIPASSSTTTTPSAPSGVYRIPVVSSRMYRDKADCQARENAQSASPLFVRQTLLDDASACLPGAPGLATDLDIVGTNLPVVAHGSLIQYCNGTKRVTKNFRDTACQVQQQSKDEINVLRTPEYVVFGCTPSSIPDTTVHTISDCGRVGSVQYYCKSWPSVGIGLDLRATAEPTQAPTSSAVAVHATTVWFLVGLAVLIAAY